jgi:peptidyl-prolyl cis-trans isomerase C
MPLSLSLRARSTRFTGGVLLGILILAGCGRESGSTSPAVIELTDGRLTLDDLRAEFEMSNGPGSFRKADTETRRQFLDATADREVYVRIAREQLGNLDPAEIRRLDQLKGGRLLGLLDERVAAKVRADSVESERVARERLGREVQLLYFTDPADSVALRAYDEIARGRPFGDVARKYGKSPLMRDKGGEMDWVSAEKLGDDLVEEVFLRDRQPGYLTDLRRSRTGSEFIQIKGFRPLDIDGRPGLLQQLMAIVERSRRRQVLTAYRDSLLQAHRVEVDPDAASALQRVMAAFGDSVSKTGPKIGWRAAPSRPPVWRLDAASRTRPLLRVDGRDLSMEAFVQGLSQVPFQIWPSAPKPESFRHQIEFRILVDLRQEEARRLGLDRNPEYFAGIRIDEERMLREVFEGKLGREVSITPAEIREEYEKNKDTRYSQQEKMRISYLVFPTESEARVWLQQARGQNYLWWQNEIGRFQATRSDIKGVSQSPEIDLTQPLPETERPLIEKARDLNAGEILGDPVQMEGGWAAARVNDRQRAGYVPFERAEPRARSSLAKLKAQDKVSELMKEGKKRYHLKVLPEPLEQIK